MASTIRITSSMGSSRLGTSIGSLASWMAGSGIWLGSLGPAKNVFVF